MSRYGSSVVDRISKDEGLMGKAFVESCDPPFHGQSAHAAIHRGLNAAAFNQQASFSFGHRCSKSSTATRLPATGMMMTRRPCRTVLTISWSILLVEFHHPHVIVILMHKICDLIQCRVDDLLLQPSLLLMMSLFNFVVSSDLSLMIVFQVLLQNVRLKDVG